MSDSTEFLEILKTNLGDSLNAIQIERVVAFREEVLKENALQNLTRLTTPKDFYEGHVLDVVHLERSGLLKLSALDLGAGMGVPGLLHALIYTPPGSQTWISCDSERKKSEFAERMIELFQLKGASAFATRGEDVLATHEVESIVARAVGSVTKIYGWFRTCSTWNNLILLKGPKWEEEWREFSSSAHQGRLVIDKTYEYSSGEQARKLKIIRLRRK